MHHRIPSIAWASDLHLDHLSADARDRLGQTLGRLDRVPLIVTGDISVAPRLVADLEFLADATTSPIYYVLGNHDHYGSSIAAVRDAVIDLAARRPQLQWLPPAGVVALDQKTALVGVDGWADGRHGDPLNTPLLLNDDRLIAELAAQPTRPGKLAVKRALADADAARLEVLLARASPTAEKIVVATHVPPFVQALPVRGRLSNPDWHPLLVCGAVGAVLGRFSAEHRDIEVVVLCGHTHVEMDVMVAPNLRCRVMGARYGEVGVQTLSS